MGLEVKKTVCIIGGPLEDIVLYLMRILQCMGLRVVLADYTMGHRMYSYIPHTIGLDPTVSAIDYRGVFYIFGQNKEWEKENEETDIMIKLYDINGYVPGSDDSIFVTDEHKRNMDFLETVKSVGRTLLFVRNYTGRSAYRLGDIALGLGCKETYVIPVNEKDIFVGTAAEYNDIYKFNGISGQLYGMLVKIVSFLYPESSETGLKKAYRLASKGGIL